MYNIIIILLFVNTVTIAKDNSSLVVFKNVDNKEEPIKSSVTVASGENLTLICRSNLNGKMYLESRIIWSKRTDNSRKKLKSSVVKKLDINEPSEITFSPVTVEDEGIYDCTNMKFNISKAVSIIIKSKRLVSDARQKRAQFEYRANNLFRSGGFDAFSEATDSWTGSSKIGPRFDTTNLGTGNWPSHSYEPAISKWTFENSLEDASSLNNVFKKTETNYVSNENDGFNSKPKNEYGVLYFMAAIGGLLLFSGIMCMCIRNNPNLRMQLARPARPVLTICNFPHTSDPAPAQVPFVPTTNNGVVTIVTVDELRDVAVREFRPSDSPPSYANSVRTKNNIEEDLPPSYDEAMANMTLSGPYIVYCSQNAAAPNIIANPTSSTPCANVVLDAPHGFARFMPKFLINRR